MKIICNGTSPEFMYFAVRMRSLKPDCNVILFDSPLSEEAAALPIILANPVRSRRPFLDTTLNSMIDRATISTKGQSFTLDRNTTIFPNATYSFASRSAVMAALRTRAIEMGCRFHTNPIPDETLAESDLIIGALPNCAAGAYTAPTKLVFRDYFCPTPIQHPHCEIRRSPFGLFHAFHMPESDQSSIISIETTTDTFDRFEVEKHSDAGTKYLAELFDHSLNLATTNVDPAWQNYSVHTLPSWTNGKHVQFGSTAYNSHHSIGLTELNALQDAEYLADLLAEHSITDALTMFEQARKPIAYSLQRASSASQTFFEHLDRYVDMPPAQLAYAYMTRSLRIDHQTMQRLAPDVARDACAEFSSNTPSVSPTPPPMFAPISLRELSIPNRIVLSPMCTYNALDGIPGDFHLVHYGSRAQGGAGLIITEMTAVTPEGRISPYCTGLYRHEHLDAWKRIVDFVHEHSESKIGMQLGHAGRKGSIGPRWKRELNEETWETLAASPIPFDKNRTTPREISRQDMDRLVTAYINATRMTDAAGFDMIELHCAHGYLLSSFISPLSNKRTDSYGGSLENRMRFPLEVFSAVRQAWPSDKPLSVRISCTDWIDGGTTIEDSIRIAQLFHDAGNDILAVSTGGVTAHQRPNVGRLYQGTFADQIRNAAKVPTMAVGGIASYGDTNMMIASGRADMCAMARGHLFDPYFTLHSAQQQGYDRIDWPREYRTATSLRMHDFW